jgi:GNAT superfamily N-acetyltransferase
MKHQMTVGKLRQTTREVLGGFPLYADSDNVDVYDISPFGRTAERWAISWDKGVRKHEGNYFEAEIDYAIETIYLLFIHLDETHRGHGLGQRLYDSVGEVGRRAGCTRYEMTASGWTSRGETRASYLARRGFVISNEIIATKQLTHSHGNE